MASYSNIFSLHEFSVTTSLKVLIISIIIFKVMTLNFCMYEALRHHVFLAHPYCISIDMYVVCRC